MEESIFQRFMSQSRGSRILHGLVLKMLGTIGGGEAISAIAAAP